MTGQRECACCGAPIRIMIQSEFCCGHCESGMCGHPQRTFTDGNPERHLHTEMRHTPWPQYPKGSYGPFDYPPKNGARF